MSEELADLLIRRIEKAGQTWPLDDERKVHQQVLKWAAFREGDKPALEQIADWESDRDYRVDMLPEKISEAFAAMLFGRDLRTTPGDEDDADRLDALVAGPAEQDDAGFSAELRGGAEISSSEGEVWWRIYANRLVADHPLIEFHSRELVVPHFIGHRLVAVAFVSSFLGADTSDAGSEKRVVWRHFEIHTRGRVENRLYRGTKDRIGGKAELTEHVETEDMDEVWDHELPGMLCGRVVNKFGRNRRLGKSDYQSAEDYLLMLNESISIGHENARLTMKKRVVVPSRLVKPRVETIDNGDGTRSVTERPRFDASEDLFVHDSLDDDLDSGDKGPYKVLEYSFDAAAQVAYKTDLISSAVTRAGIMPQFVGVPTGPEGSADTGVALRVRLLPTTSAVSGKGQYWDQAIPHMLLLAQLLDAMPIESGGFGVQWKDPGTAPAVERTDPLPADKTEQATRHSALVGAELESRRTAIRDLHPEWTDSQVNEELDLIEEDRPAPVTFPSFGSFPDPNAPDDGAPA